MLEPVVWFVAGLVMIVLEYFLTVKVRSRCGARSCRWAH